MITDLQNHTGASARELGRLLGLGYRRLLRWRQRAALGRPALAWPGPKKAEPLPLEELRREIAALRHGLRRSRGTLALYRQHRPAISRRALAALIAAERTARRLAARRRGQRVTWLEPNLAWVIDATEHGTDRWGRPLIVHAPQDLCSRFRFEPLTALESRGPAIARHLAALFRTHGAPLFLKRDNGSPFNHAAVDAVLAAHGVIPLNSPPHYPQYNGAVEKGIRDLQDALGECLSTAHCWQPDRLQPYLVAVHHHLNCRPRRSLQGRTACEAYHHLPRHRYGRRERSAIFDLIRTCALDSVRQLEKVDQRSLDAAWRHAAESWLRCQGLITVSLNPKTVTLFS
jgi:hypothetical protein